jgi:hypothetical protein
VLSDEFDLCRIQLFALRMKILHFIEDDEASFFHIHESDDLSQSITSTATRRFQGLTDSTQQF